MEGSGKTEDKPHWLEPVQGNREETPMGTSKINGAEDLITEPQQTWAVAESVLRAVQTGKASHAKRLVLS